MLGNNFEVFINLRRVFLKKITSLTVRQYIVKVFLKSFGITVFVVVEDDFIHLLKFYVFPKTRGLIDTFVSFDQLV